MPGNFSLYPGCRALRTPTGYPLYVLLGWLWSHLLPAGNVAWRMNLLSAVFAAATVVVLYRLATLMLAQALPDAPAAARLVSAACVAATFALSQTFWSLALIAEVYTLHVLLLALMLWLAMQTGCVPDSRRTEQTREEVGGSPPTPPRAFPAFRGAPMQAGQKKDGPYTLLLALVFGLGLAHHVTTVLLLPALLLYLWLEGALRFTPGWLARHALVALAPLLLYLYLPLAAPYTPYATINLSEAQPPLVLYENTPAGFVAHVTATVFRGDLKPAAVGLGRFEMAGQLLIGQVGWVGVGLAVIGLLVLLRGRKWALLALTGLAFGAIVAFNLIYFIGDVFVLFTPAWLLVCLWLGVGILALTSNLARSFVRGKMGAPEEAAVGYMKTRLETNMHRLVTTGLALFFFALPVWLLISNGGVVDQSRTVQAAQRWQSILREPLPDRAVLLSNDRNEMMPMWYFQFVEQQRPDLVGLFPLIVPEPAYSNVGRVLDQALASQRPVFLVKAMDGLELKADIVPAGSLFAATPLPADPGIRPVDVTLGNGDGGQVTLTGIALTPATVNAGERLTVTLWWQAVTPLAADYTSYIHLVTADGQRLAQSDHQPGGVYYPSSLWLPGEPLRDRHVLSLPPETEAGAYRLVAGMYRQPQPGQIEALGSSVDVGGIDLE
jgi:hypothetical protein